MDIDVGRGVNARIRHGESSACDSLGSLQRFDSILVGCYKLLRRHEENAVANIRNLARRGYNRSSRGQINHTEADFFRCIFRKDDLEAVTGRGPVRDNRSNWKRVGPKSCAARKQTGDQYQSDRSKATTNHDRDSRLTYLTTARRLKGMRAGLFGLQAISKGASARLVWLASFVRSRARSSRPSSAAQGHRPSTGRAPWDR